MRRPVPVKPAVKRPLYGGLEDELVGSRAWKKKVRNPKKARRFFRLLRRLPNLLTAADGDIPANDRGTRPAGPARGTKRVRTFPKAA